MEIVVVKMLFILSASAQFGKHVYVTQRCTWSDAQAHCRRLYTDLSPITTPEVEKRLKNVTIGKFNGEFWIGLYKGASNWKWSGGGDATNILWHQGQPDNSGCAGVVCWRNCKWDGWHDTVPSFKMPFFCFNLIVVNNEMTWERAMRYCREQHTELTSLASETEHLLALSKIKHDNINERVWIGLRYLADGWLWVNGDPLEFEAWRKGGDQDHLCPIHKRCGALTSKGVWENWDCQDKLDFICY